MLSNFSHHSLKSTPIAPHITIGVLALQGCVKPHKLHIESCGASFKEVKTREDLNSIDGLILPGGESTTMLRLIKVFCLDQSLEQTFARIPVWGICAGTILMAKEVSLPAQSSFNLLDISVQRNGYGNQLNSFNTVIQSSSVSFIRAPLITNVGSGACIKALVNNNPVWVEEGSCMATTFHPELSSTAPSIMHKSFIKMILKSHNYVNQQ